nr:MAG TPA: hypothetical protein [Bacteriophage sp.]
MYRVNKSRTIHSINISIFLSFKIPNMCSNIFYSSGIYISTNTLLSP